MHSHVQQLAVRNPVLIEPRVKHFLHVRNLGRRAHVCRSSASKKYNSSQQQSLQPLTEAVTETVAKSFSLVCACLISLDGALPLAAYAVDAGQQQSQQQQQKQHDISSSGKHSLLEKLKQMVGSGNSRTQPGVKVSVDRAG